MYKDASLRITIALDRGSTDVTTRPMYKDTSLKILLPDDKYHNSDPHTRTQFKDYYCSDLPSVELTDLTELSLPSPKHDDYGLNNFYSISLYFLMRIDSIWTHHQHQQIDLQNN